LEGLVGAVEALGGERFFNCGSELAALFVARFFQAKEGALPEWFDEALAPVREDGRFLAEPGHHYEWIWLLHRYEAFAAAAGLPTDPDLQLAAGALFEFAERYGVDPASGLVAYGVWSDGTVSDGWFPVWAPIQTLAAVG